MEDFSPGTVAFMDVPGQIDEDIRVVVKFKCYRLVMTLYMVCGGTSSTTIPVSSRSMARTGASGHHLVSGGLR